MAIPYNKLKQLLEEAFSDSQIHIEDLAGDQDHYSILIKSKAFQNKNRVEQHKMVYDALKETMASELHAIAIRTEHI